MSKTTQTAQSYWDDRSELFSNYYTKPTLFDKMFRKAVYTRTAVTLKTCQEFPGGTVLDIGSGPGVNSVTWLKNSKISKLVGIDFAPNMNEFARDFTQKKGVGDRAEFIEGDFMSYDWGAQKFDISTAMGVLDYIEDAESFIKKIAGVTSGAFVISWPENGIRMALRRQRYTCPLFHYDVKEIERLHSLCPNVKKLDIVTSDGGWVTVGRI
jgi:2-polyprenyl-3-methyl-5-hydroxy-6-metoxy-1,4-benzoquinol methylase